MKLTILNMFLQNNRHRLNRFRHYSIAVDLILLAWLLGVLVAYLSQFRHLIEPMLKLLDI